MTTLTYTYIACACIEKDLCLLHVRQKFKRKSEKIILITLLIIFCDKKNVIIEGEQNMFNSEKKYFFNAFKKRYSLGLCKTGLMLNKLLIMLRDVPRISITVVTLHILYTKKKETETKDFAFKLKNLATSTSKWLLLLMVEFMNLQQNHKHNLIYSTYL